MSTSRLLLWIIVMLAAETGLIVVPACQIWRLSRKITHGNQVLWCGMTILTGITVMSWAPLMGWPRSIFTGGWIFAACGTLFLCLIARSSRRMAAG